MVIGAGPARSGLKPGPTHGPVRSRPFRRPRSPSPPPLRPIGERRPGAPGVAAGSSSRPWSRRSTVKCAAPWSSRMVLTAEPRRSASAARSLPASVASCSTPRAGRTSPSRRPTRWSFGEPERRCRPPDGPRTTPGRRAGAPRCMLPATSRPVHGYSCEASRVVSAQKKAAGRARRWGHATRPAARR